MIPSGPTLRADRLDLIASTPRLALAAVEGAESLTRAAGARVPAAWPPALYADSLRSIAARLAGDPSSAGWLSWLFLLRGESEERTLVGIGGFGGRPDAALHVEIGFALLDEFHGRGLATEAVCSLLTWAFSREPSLTAIAETLPALPASLAVLRKAGFREVGAGASPGSLRFERVHPRRASEEIAHLVASVEGCTLPLADWHQREHLTLALWYATRHPLAPAIDLTRAAIQRFNAHHGIAQTPERGYHETLTVAFVRLVAALASRLGPRPIDELAFEVTARLGDRRALLAHYTLERIRSWEARIGWVEPDLAPLP